MKRVVKVTVLDIFKIKVWLALAYFMFEVSKKLSFLAGYQTYGGGLLTECGWNIMHGIGRSFGFDDWFDFFYKADLKRG